MSDGGGISLSVKFNAFPGIADKLDVKMALRLDQALAGLEQDAKSETPTKTGGLQASGYRVSPVTSTYASAVAAMLARNPKARPLLPPGLGKTSGVTGYVGFAADYAPYVHDGHHTRGGHFVAANPFLLRALARNKNPILQALAHGIQEACKEGGAR